MKSISKRPIENSAQNVSSILIKASVRMSVIVQTTFFLGDLPHHMVPFWNQHIPGHVPTQFSS